MSNYNLDIASIEAFLYDSINGKVSKNVSSGDGGDVEDPDNTDGGSGRLLWQHCLLLLQLSE